MDKLNDYLQQLLSSYSDELRLEPDKNPYLVSQNGVKDAASSPLAGANISAIVFPLIPQAVKATLPNLSEVEFIHNHSLGNFSFTVQKSPSGFNVTVRPIFDNSTRSLDTSSDSDDNFYAYVDTPNTVIETAPESFPIPLPETPVSFDLESSSANYDLTSAENVSTSTIADVVYDEYQTAQEYVPTGAGPEIDLISFNDPAYQTVFSDTADYEPPGRRDDFISGENTAPAAFEPSIPHEIVAPPQTQSFHRPSPATVVSPPLPAAVSAEALEDGVTAEMDRLFNKMAEAGASDLHLSVSMLPMVRKDGKMKTLEDGATTLTPAAMLALLTSIMPKKNQEEFAARHDTDFAYEIPGLARFRCNVFMDRKGMGGVFRIIPSEILTAEQLGLSKAIMDLCTLSKGLVVVTGPTGSGKSTTLCAMVDSINKTREDHIITIEDPIEFTHENKKCLVNQREVHNHTDSFKDALRAALREDPDILLVGEMRDLETISIAIETAETGHLVFGTLHTTTASSTVDRIIDQFPADRQQQIRVMLSESLKGVIAQTLLPKKGGGRVAALEILVITPAISNLIREGKTFQIPSAMQTGKTHGMVMLNDALFEHVKNGLVEPRDAYLKAVDKTGFETMLQRGGFKL